MANVLINKETCIGCGLCVDDCSRKAIKLVNEIAEFDPATCNECSHCVAICPQESISMPDYDENEILEYSKDKLNLDPDNFLYYQKFRRSIRKFKDKKIEEEKLDKIIEAGRYSPTASNRQLNRYIVIKDKIDQVREMVIETLYKVAADPDFDMGPMPNYRSSWIQMYEDYKKGIDRLFFDAPEIIVIVSEDKSGFQDVNGGLAASRMELQANSLGLGVCYIGFFKRAILYNSEIRKIIGLKDNEDFILSFVLGYPDVSYQRTVNRKKADVRII